MPQPGHQTPPPPPPQFHRLLADACYRLLTACAQLSPGGRRAACLCQFLCRVSSGGRPSSPGSPCACSARRVEFLLRLCCPSAGGHSSYSSRQQKHAARRRVASLFVCSVRSRVPWRRRAARRCGDALPAAAGSCAMSSPLPSPLSSPLTRRV